MNRMLMVLLASAAIGVGVLMAGAGGSKVEASQPTSGRDLSTTTQQGHKGGLDPALEKSLEVAFERSFQQSGAPGAIAAVRTPEGTWVGTLGVADLASGEPM